MNELTTRNYIRISIINHLLALPLFLFFGWIGYALTSSVIEEPIFTTFGATLYSLPFMLTILHGHVTIAVGASHRDEYYTWLNAQNNIHGIFFLPILASTRFRFSTLAVYILYIISFYLWNPSF